MNALPESLKKLIDEFSKLPGIGKKTAERLSIYILKTNKEEALKFSDSILNLKNNIQTCNICHAFTDSDCFICSDSHRDSQIICVVEDPVDIFLIEKSGFRGKYHVLDGLISPLDGIKPENLNIDEALLTEDKDMVEDLILVAVKLALENADKKAEEMMKSVTGGSLPNFNMPGF